MENSLRASKDPGVPEALPRSLLTLRERLGAERIDKLWIFPPLVRGRRERGLLVASAFTETDQRLLHTVTYQAERTGRALTVEAEIFEEGVSPSERVPRVIQGVVARSTLQLGDAREVEIDGSAAQFAELLAEFDETLLPTLAS